jgi:mono/diheme cytochrome c family protein
MKMFRKRYRIAIIVAFVMIVVAGALYEWIVPGLSSARTVPPRLEVAIATWLLHQSIPEQSRRQANPLGSDAADIVAGRDLFGENCETCHAYDGGGKTRIGAGEYPHPPPLRVAVASMSDGEVFYHIRNGIRNTGMPAWDMPDRQIWQLVAYIRHLPSPARLAAAQAPESDREGPSASATYVGSAACKKCHEEIYARWSKNENGERGARSPRASGSDHSRFLQTRSVAHLHQG